MNFIKKITSIVFKPYSTHQTLKEKVDDEFSKIENMSVAEAYSSAMLQIEKYSQCFEIIENDRPNDSVDSFDEYTARFFRKYKEVYIIDGDSRICVYEDKPTEAHAGVLICKCLEDDCELFVEKDSPLIHAYRRGKKIEDFKSIFHYILISI